MIQALWSFDIGASCAEHQPHGFSHPIQVNAGLAQQDARQRPSQRGARKALAPAPSADGASQAQRLLSPFSLQRPITLHLKGFARRTKTAAQIQNQFTSCGYSKLSNRQAHLHSRNKTSGTKRDK